MGRHAAIRAADRSVGPGGGPAIGAVGSKAELECATRRTVVFFCDSIFRQRSPPVVPGERQRTKTWMPGIKPGMTLERWRIIRRRRACTKGGPSRHDAEDAASVRT